MFTSKVLSQTMKSLSVALPNWVFPTRVFCCGRGGNTPRRDSHQQLLNTFGNFGRSNMNVEESYEEWDREELVEDHEPKDAILYALGIGATTEKHLNLVYENHPNFEVFPTFVARSALNSLDLENCPGINYDLAKTMHAEQYIEVFKEIPKSGAIRTVSKVTDLLQRGKHMYILGETNCFDNETEDRLAYLQFLIVQLNRFPTVETRWRSDLKECVKMPAIETGLERFVYDIPKDLPVLYRQASGDLNPLHVNPEFARSFGLKAPIVHGFCTLGFVVRSILDETGEKMKSVKVRFSGPVYPGEQIEVRILKIEKRIHFEVFSLSGAPLISNAYLDVQ